MDKNTKHNIEYFLRHQKLENNEDIGVCNLEIKESKIKGGGMGVYTKKEIPVNCFVTYYSPTYLLWGGNGPKKNMRIYTNNKIIKDYNQIVDICLKNKEYMINYQNLEIISEPGYRNKQYLGHLLNDKGYKTGKIYRPLLNNCSFDDKGLSIISTRDIKKGEELYVSYGKEYWNYNKIS